MHLPDTELGVGDATVNKIRHGSGIPGAHCPMQEKDINQLVSVIQL